MGKKMKISNKTAYNELYLNNAQKTIAHSFDYAVKKMNYTLKEYAELFANFEYIHLIEEGHPRYVAGMSGIELAKAVCNISNKRFGILPYCPGVEFWTGWIIAYYQWLRNLSYKKIFDKFPVERFVNAYPTFHECNKKRMFEYMDRVIFGEDKVKAYYGEI